ncbi:hypothetical protein HHK36_021132 [Tetracentron sinense]|uniref:Uncharacterized protein n=1 Tax=Tetracentron sinense TaxID=13715 RepID=A0A834YQY9_TETSI|nr:hypothetical protein HHK36_021132 [Tetracentron sinense]
MEAMQAQTMDVIKRMKEITLVMQTPEQVLEAQGVNSGDIEDLIGSRKLCGLQVFVIQRGETIYRKAIAMVLLQRNSKPELIWFSFSKYRELDKSPDCTLNLRKDPKVTKLPLPLGRAWGASAYSFLDLGFFSGGGIDTTSRYSLMLMTIIMRKFALAIERIGYLSNYINFLSFCNAPNTTI